jgi:cytochrome c biogenesis protein CcdA
MAVAGFRRYLRKLPRAVYWTTGAAIAFVGATIARLLAEQVPEYRVPIWLAGGIVIFFGLAILSLGTKARLQLRDQNEKEGGQA